MRKIKRRNKENKSQIKNAIYIHYISNEHCVKCDAVEKQMIKIGAITMCSDCFKSIFKPEGNMIIKEEERLKYAKIYNRSLKEHYGEKL